MAVDSTFGTSGVAITALQTREDSVVQTGRVPTDAAKIDKGAKEFEAVLLGSWLQQAEQSFATVPGADDEDDPGKQQMTSMAVQSLATSMAASGGLGIGRMIAAAMHRIAEKQNVPALPSPGTNPSTKAGPATIASD